MAKKKPVVVPGPYYRVAQQAAVMVDGKWIAVPPHPNSDRSYVRQLGRVLISGDALNEKLAAFAIKNGKLLPDASGEWAMGAAVLLVIQAAKELEATIRGIFKYCGNPDAPVSSIQIWDVEPSAAAHELYAFAQHVQLSALKGIDAGAAERFKRHLVILRRNADAIAAKLPPTAPNTPKSNSPHLTADDAIILRCLHNAAPVLASQYDLEASTRISRKTLSKRLVRLVGDGLLCKPNGERGGYGLTDKGRETAGTLATR